MNDMIHSLSPGQRIGSSTYAALARKFADGESMIENLRPSDPTSPLDDECLKLLFAADAEAGFGKAHRTLMTKLESCGPMSEKMVIGIVKALLNSKVLAKTGSEHLVVALMRYFVRSLPFLGCPSGGALRTCPCRPNQRMHGSPKPCGAALPMRWGSWRERRVSENIHES